MLMMMTLIEIRRYLQRALLSSVMLLVIPLVLLPASASAAVKVGKVITSIGVVTARAEDGSSRSLKRRSAILEGDMLLTGEDSRAQIRFKDGALVSLRPNTEFLVKEYKYNGKQDGTESAAMKLIKGGMRTVTGAIGKQHKDRYRMETAVATIGIRGTYYGLRMCAGNCGAGVEDGLYGGVIDGEIFSRNGSGEDTFGNDQYFRIASYNSSPVRLLTPPGVVFDGTQGRRGKQKQRRQPQRDHRPRPTQPPRTPPPAVIRNNTSLQNYLNNYSTGAQTTGSGLPGSSTPIGTAGFLAPNGMVLGVSFISSNRAIGGKGDGGGFARIGSNSFAVLDYADLAPNLIIYKSGDCIPCVMTTYRVTAGGPGIVDQTGAGLYGVKWGRWNNGVYIYENGVLETIESTIISNPYLHYIYSNKATRQPKQVLKNLYTIGGPQTVTYSYAGGPNAFDKAGSSGYTTSAITMTFDLPTQELTGFNMQVDDTVTFWVSNTLLDQNNNAVTSLPIDQIIGDKGFNSSGTNNMAGTTQGHTNFTCVGVTCKGMMTTTIITTDDGSNALSHAGLVTRP
ncbi:MAG: hypothetical protein BMS9Abin26_0412 [Gammaproteobacteria bacterium]|nr:MAG: hypothetical protein BMS9Abin26_0412 [Gammaproteobacteria bacterium]